METLRKLLRLPVLVLAALFGRFAWSAPRWMLATRDGAGRASRWSRAHPGKVGAGIATALVLVVGGWYGYVWYVSRPQPYVPPLISFEVAAPARTDYEQTPIVIHPMVVTFSRSIAPIALVGKDVTAGITTSPEIAGTWTWTDDHTLRFQPKEDWPIGLTYAVRFDKATAFAEHTRVASDHLKFGSPPFEATVTSSEFYQDPQDAAAKKAVIQIGFSHPVDTAELEKRIVLRIAGVKGDAGKRKFAVNYDERKLNAYVHSEPLSVPRDESRIELAVEPGVRAARGGPGTKAALTGAVTIPGLYSLAIESVNATLADNERYEPEQVLVLEASQTVGEKDIAKVVNAYVLPRYHPKTPEADRTEPYDWSDVSQVGEDILKTATKLELEPVPSEHDYAQMQSFKFHAEPGLWVFVKVEKGLKSFGGYVLGKRADYTVQVPQFPRILRFLSEGSLLSLSGERRVSVVSRNVPKMQVEIARVLPEQLQHLVTFNYGTYAKPQLGALNADHITERFTQKIDLPAGEPAKAHYEGVDLGQYLGSADRGKRGVFLLSLSEYKEPAKADESGDASTEESGEGDAEGASDGEGEYEGEGDGESEATPSDSVYDQRLIVVTDLGLMVKKALDGAQDVYVQSIRSGAPVEGATVEVLGKNGQTLFSGNSDHDGLVHFAKLEGLTREKAPAMYTVRKGEDLSFLPVGTNDRRLDYSRFDIGGINNAKDAGQLSAHLFSDRGIYRPGDTFNIGMIIRAADWTKKLDGIPLEAEIVDPRGLTAERRTIRLSPSGFEELSYTPQETAPTGTWSVNLHIIKDDRADAQIGSVSVQVKEFLPDRMKATAHLSSEVAEGWVKPDALKALVSLQNLFGTPATERKVEATLTLRPAYPAFRSYADYRFFDPQRAKDGYSEPLGEQRTDLKGETEYALDLTKYGKATYQLYFLARGFEAEGGRGVAAEAQTLVSSLDYLVGAKPDGDMEFIQRGAKRAVNVIAIDPKAKKTAAEGLKLALVERRFVSILTKQDSGVYKYESKLKEIPLKEEPLAIPASGLDVPLRTDTAGSFALVVRNARNEELNRIDYAVAGEANVSRSLERNAELSLTLSKKDYAPGEEISIAIRAPYAGAGLITIERDKVYARAWFKASTTSSIQKIKVPADFEGNGYVNVQFVRDPGSDEIYMSPLSYGVVPFSVNLNARRDALTLQVPELVKPGEELKIRLTAAQPARVVVFAVDEGILQVARYKLGDPLDFFFQKRRLEVTTSQILDLILPEFDKLNGMAAPGGDEDAMLGRHLNPFRRKHAKPIAFWSGIVDVQGAIDLSYPVPDYFNGKIRVMAVAVAPDRIGITQAVTTVRGDFVLSPNVPAMVAPGDEFEVSSGVANNLVGLGGKSVPVTVKLDVDAQRLQVIGSASQELPLGEMREGAVVFKVKALERPGAAELKFTASANGKSAKQDIETSVRPASPFRTELRIGSLGKGTVEIKPLRAMFDEHAKRDAAASYSPLVLAQGLGTYLRDFEHRCTEQLISQAMPALVFAKRPELSNRLETDSADIDANAIARLIGVLRSRQNAEGGFGLWTSTPHSERFVSAYAMQFLLEAKERGYAVPVDMVENGNRYLAQLAADESDSTMPGLRERAYAAYLLTRQGTVTSNYLAAVTKRLDERFAKTWRDDVTAAYIGSAMMLLKQDQDAARLIAGPQKVLVRTAEHATYAYERYFDPLVGDAQVLALIARHFPDRAKALSPQAIANIVKPLSKGWYNTLSSALTILALDSYGSRMAAAGENKLSIAAVGADGKATLFAKPQGALVRGAFDAAATALRVDNGADLTAWYQVSQGGFDRAPPTSELKEGVEIVREYTDDKGRRVEQVALGQEIQVHLRIRATRPDGVGNLAIVDLLPGGFEPVLEAPSLPQADDEAQGGGEDGAAEAAWRSPLGTLSSSWTPEYADIRDDRVVLYGSATNSVREFVYRIRSTNAGTFVVPPAYGESLYDRTVQARSLGGKIEVAK